jgi:23S rRNA pseudouridine1911/1915/1917 synthase
MTIPDLDESNQLLKHQVAHEHCGQRVDQVAAEVFSSYSRARLQIWIKSGRLKVDGKPCKPKNKVYGGERMVLLPEADEQQSWAPEAIDLDLVHSDEDVIVINKPAGLVVHPGAANASGTLLNGLLYRFPELSTIPRAGIVHRLDKDTTGLMVVARSLKSHYALIKQLQTRTMGREYEALVMGELLTGGTVHTFMGRHPRNRLKMSVIPESSRAKEAITHYRVECRFPGYTHVICRLETGRTHQIRVHMCHIRHPLIGDSLYSGRQRWKSGTTESLKQQLLQFNRQALHARRLTLIHPGSGRECSWFVSMPTEMQDLLHALRDEPRIDS